MSNGTVYPWKAWSAYQGIVVHSQQDQEKNSLPIVDLQMLGVVHERLVEQCDAIKHRDLLGRDSQGAIKSPLAKSLGRPWKAYAKVNYLVCYKHRVGKRRLPRVSAGSQTFVSRAARLDHMGQTDAALDLIYDSVDELMKNGAYPRLDAVLKGMQVPNLSVDVLLGVLTATLPAKNRLTSRPSLFLAVEKTLRDRDQYEEGLLTGLES